MGPAGLPMVRPEHVLNCSPPSPGGCGSGSKATVTDSRVPPPPSAVDVPRVARGGVGEGVPSTSGPAELRHAKPGLPMSCYILWFASAEFTQFSLGYVVCFVVSSLGGSPPLGSGPPLPPLAFVPLPSPRHARTHEAPAPRPLARVEQRRILPY